MPRTKTKVIAAALVLSLPLIHAWGTRADSFTTTLNVDAIRRGGGEEFIAVRERHDTGFERVVVEVH